MQALGMIETKGLLAAIESADAMLTAADVTLLESTLVGGGLVTITVTGEVSATRASVDAAVAAVTRIDTALLVSQNVITRHHVEVGETIINTVPLIELQNEKAEEKAAPVEKAEAKAEQKVEAETESEVEKAEEAVEVKSEETVMTEEEPVTEVSEMHKADMDKLVASKGIEVALEKIGKCKVVKLRNLAREYEDFGISGRLISKANKDALLEEFRKYYNK